MARRHYRPYYPSWYRQIRFISYHPFIGSLFAIAATFDKTARKGSSNLGMFADLERVCNNLEDRIKRAFKRLCTPLPSTPQEPRRSKRTPVTPVKVRYGYPNHKRV